MRKIPFAGIVLTSQRVRRLQAVTSELPGRPAYKNNQYIKSCTLERYGVRPIGIEKQCYITILHVQRQREGYLPCVFMRLALVCFYCLVCFLFYILSRRCPLLATSLSALFCLLSMLISDSRFDLVWSRLSCDHGWIRTTTTTPPIVGNFIQCYSKRVSLYVLNLL